MLDNAYTTPASRLTTVSEHRPTALSSTQVTNGKNVSAGLLIERLHATPGYLFGMRQACLIVRLQYKQSHKTDVLVRHLLRTMDSELPAVAGMSLIPTKPLSHPVPPVLEALSSVLHRIQAAAGLAVSLQSRLLDDAEGYATLALPGPAPAETGEALAWLVWAWDALAAEPHAKHLPESVLSAYGLLQKRLSRLAAAGSNNRHLVRSAYALEIPVQALPGGVFQFGWGLKSRLFKNTISDATSVIANSWSNNKHQTNTLLRMAGLPVPTQALVASLEDALAAARRIGYPVVLKASDHKQVFGVKTGLQDELELREAYARSGLNAEIMLIETHVQGKSYKVEVMQGQVTSVVQRSPANVEGDGVHDITHLVAAINHDRKANKSFVHLEPIVLDAEASHLLASEGLNRQSVLWAGQKAVLRRVASLASGGSLTDVTQIIHPDNAALCVQAAAMLRLDMAVLDLLMPDISRSWREEGAAFCEVTAQPQSGDAQAWMFEKFLKGYVSGRGRIPAVLVLTSQAKSQVASSLSELLRQAGLSGTTVQGSIKALLAACRAELMAPDLGIIVVATDGAGLARWGLPLDRFDLLVIDGWVMPDADKSRTLDLLEPHIALALVSQTAPERALLESWGLDHVRMVADADALLQAASQLLVNPGNEI